MHRSFEAMHIKTAHFSPKLDMQSYSVTLKTVNVPKSLHLYPNDVSMQIWSKYINEVFRQNADTKFLFTAGGVFWYRFWY